ncbi:MAG: response regulator transcription factor [Lewinella sp.]|nr:response regulator transcription factor [Lewinella sp.]
MRILLIEDETGIANFLRQGLEEEGYFVDLAQDGASGLSMALTGAYDLLLVDWMLPGMTGLEVCRVYRSEKYTSPVIFLTARDTVQDTVLGLQTGANDYIKKPFHFDELLARIEVQLRPKNETATDTEFILGKIKLNVETHQVWKDEDEILLTQKEFDLLEYLIRNKGKVCRRSQIIESVWDIHFEYNTGVIDVYINALRKKLNLKKDEDYIQTIRGIGYIAKELEQV